MTIEKLTDNERAAITVDFDGLGEKALRIIDTQASALAASTDKIERLLEGQRYLASNAEQWHKELTAANELLEQVRIQVAPHRLAAFEPKTDDQATNAGRFHVALYLLKEVHAIVFGREPQEKRQLSDH